MTNRSMVKQAIASVPEAGPQPNATPLPAMPAPEGSATPTTDQEPVDSPQPNASVKRSPPSADRPGLGTERT